MPVNRIPGWSLFFNTITQKYQIAAASNQYGTGWRAVPVYTIQQHLGEFDLADNALRVIADERKKVSEVRP